MLHQLVGPTRRGFELDLFVFELRGTIFAMKDPLKVLDPLVLEQPTHSGIESLPTLMTLGDPNLVSLGKVELEMSALFELFRRLAQLAG